MLLSLFKIVLFIAAIAALTFGAEALMEMQGGLIVQFAGREFSLDPLQAAIALVVLAIALWLAIRLAGLLVAVFRFLNGDETAITRWFSRNRERKGYEALSEGMVALASGEGRVAMAKAAKAERYLHKPELTNLLTAQAAEMTGDTARAQEVYKRLLGDDRTRFVGVRGLMKQKLAEGDIDTALKLAQKAFALKPRSEEMQDLLLRLQADKGDWKGARATLAAKHKYGALPRDVFRRRDAVLALSEAKEILNEGNDIAAREEAIEANKRSPDLVPAAVMAADSYIAEGRPRYATRILTKAWNASPHPDLAAAFARIVPDEDPSARRKRFKALTRLHPESEETRLLEAELAIADGDYAAARKALGDLPEKKPTQRSLTLMAAIERGEGADDAVVRAWLARAVTAPRGPQWVCENCNHIHAQWAPVCSHCQAFDTLTWKEPEDDGEVQLPGGSDMLPLLVTAPEKAVAEMGGDTSVESAEAGGDETGDEAEAADTGAETAEEDEAKTQAP